MLLRNQSGLTEHQQTKENWEDKAKETATKHGSKDWPVGAQQTGQEMFDYLFSPTEKKSYFFTIYTYEV